MLETSLTMPCSLLMTGEDEVEMLGIVDGVEDRQNSSSWISKDMLYVISDVSVTLSGVISSSGKEIP